MGTRADFYIGRGEGAEWIGSIAWDGYPDGIDIPILTANTPGRFREAVRLLLADRDDATLPAQGWPWPWETSHTTDYAYALDGEVVYGSNFGGNWFVAKEGLQEDRGGTSKSVVFPNMKDIQKVDFGKRSGIIIGRVVQ